MESAKEALSGKWGIAILGFLIHTIIISVSSYASLIISGPLSFGISLFALNISQGKELKLEPNSKQSISPPKTLGMVINKSIYHCSKMIGFVNFFKKKLFFSFL